MKKSLHTLLLFILPALLMLYEPGMSYGQGGWSLYIGDNAYIVFDGGTRTDPVYLVVDDYRGSAIEKANDAQPGWIISEADGHYVRWNCGISAELSTYEIPFGYGTSMYIPFSFSPLSDAGDLADVIVATYGTPLDDNVPYMYDVPNPPAEPGMVTDVIDRWWRVKWEGLTGGGGLPQIFDMLFTYRSEENTIDFPALDIKPQEWLTSDQVWDPPWGLGVAGESGVGSSGASNTGVMTDINITNSVWVLASSAVNPLPISMLYFNAQCEGSDVVIDWSTASETNNSGFTIQRSANGSEFASLGIVAGAGNSNSVQTYHFVDDHPLRGTAYYRLKQTDNDGKFSYSKIIQSGNCDETDTPFDVFAYYDQGSHSVTVVLNGYSGPATVTLRDITGRQLTSKSIQEYGPVKLNASALSTGIYFIVVQTELKTVTTRIMVGK